MTRSTLWLKTSHYNEIIQDIERWGELETGGVFMGYQAPEAFVVTDIVGCGPNSKHRKHSFMPDQNYQLEEISKVYFDSNKNILYLGDWHSHPCSSPTMSHKDKKTLTKIATDSASMNKNPIMTIFGYEGLKSHWVSKSYLFKSGYCRWFSLNEFSCLEIDLKLY